MDIPPADITLHALAPLGVYKFNCKRAIVSIIDGRDERIIADATRSKIRRSYSLSGDSYGGKYTDQSSARRCSLATELFTDQAEGLDPHYVNTESVMASRTRCIIHDMTMHNNNSCFREFLPLPLIQWPDSDLRFYAAVPIYGTSGRVLGTYCVVDDVARSRGSFGDDAVCELQEAADAIAQHLENARIVRRHRRTERLTEGLATFIEDRSNKTLKAQSAGRFARPSISLPQLSIPGAPLPFHTKSAATDEGLPPEEQKPFVDPVMGSASQGLYTDLANLSSPASASASSKTLFSDSPNITSPWSQTQYTESSGPITIKIPEDTRSYEDGDGGIGKIQEKDTGEFSPIIREPESEAVSRRILSIFSSASHLLRDSMDLDGVMFFSSTKNDADGGM